MSQPDPQMTTRFAVMAQIKEAAVQVFGPDHEADVAKITSHALNTRELSVGETLLLGMFLTWAAEQQMANLAK